MGFWGAGEKGHLFSWSWGALAIISKELGSKLLILGSWGHCQNVIFKTVLASLGDPCPLRSPFMYQYFCLGFFTK